MNYQCCVPGCTSYSNVAKNFVHFPRNSRWRKNWMSLIPKKNWLVDDTTVICLEHFKPEDLNLFESSYYNNDGQEFFICNSIKDGAVPTVFRRFSSIANPDFTKVINDDSKDMYGMALIDQNPPTTFGDLENYHADFLIDFYFLKWSYREKLNGALNDWRVFSENDYILFFCFAFQEGLPTIISSIKIDVNLKVVVTIGGKLMDLLDLTWILPVCGIISQWSQIRMLLKTFHANA